MPRSQIKTPKSREKRTSVKFHVVLHQEDDGSFWSEVVELPGCFASGFSLKEIQEATFDAIQLWLPDGIHLGDPTWAAVDPQDEDGDEPGKPHRDKRRQRVKRRDLLVCA